MLNPYQRDRICRIARKEGFDRCQKMLYEACENVINAIEGDSYGEFARSLAGIFVETEKTVIALDEEIRKQTNAKTLNYYGKRW